jgi:arginine decarboxylase
MEQFGKRFPGFEREVHGIEVDSDGNYWMRAVMEEPEKKRRKSKRRRTASEPQ